MKLNKRWLGPVALGLLGMSAFLPRVSAQEKTTAKAGNEVKIAVSTAAPPPPVSITLLDRHGHITPLKGKHTRTGSGLIDVATPSPDTVVITMTGAVFSSSDMNFELAQGFEITFDDPKVKKAKLTVEGRVIGLLRSHPKGMAEYTDACAQVVAGPVAVLSLSVPPHSVSGDENLAVNDHDGPKTVPVLPGKYLLHQTFRISAHSSSCLHKRPSAEFAPDPATDPTWAGYYDPFHGVKKDTFGFQVTLKLASAN